MTSYFGIPQYAVIDTVRLAYLERDSQESASGRIKDNPTNAIVPEFLKEHRSSTVRELYKVGDISLSVFSRWTPRAQPVCFFIFCGLLSRSGMQEDPSERTKWPNFCLEP